LNLPLHIARRYLFAKKSHNAINTISIISVCGITIATLALVCVLSVFNGFTDMVTITFSAFDPELQITPVQGKVFKPDTAKMQAIKDLSEVDFISESLEENALMIYGERQEPVLLKGVSPEFEKLADIDKLIEDGNFILREGDIDNGVIGGGLAMMMGARANFVDPVYIYMPKRNVRVNPANPSSAFDRKDVFVSGIFILNQPKYDDQLFIVSIDLARELLRYENEVSSIDIKIKAGADIADAQAKIKSILGDGFLVKNRFEQQEDLYRMVNVEKWVTFLILAIVMIIAAFNIVGSLTILIIEKNEDIKTLKSLGANNKLILRIFLFEGWLITFTGTIIGIILGLGACLLQQHFGLIKFSSSSAAFLIDHYPVSVQAWDIVIILIAVSIAGFLAVLYPVNNLRKRL
jgi:ABC-type lipoprotein release transport system permease subunit